MLQVISGIHDIAAVMIDKGAKIGGHHLTFPDYIRPLLKVPDPQIMGVVFDDALPDFHLAHAQLDAGGAGLLEVAVECASGDYDAVAFIEKLS